MPIRLFVSALTLVAFSATGVAAQSSTLGFAAGIPMGFETAGPTSFTYLEIAATGKTVREALEALTAADHRQVHGLTVTGLQLRTALDALATMDGRYEWRVVDDVVVFRPRGAWTDPRDPLFRPVPGFQLNDAPVTQAIGALMPYVGAPERAATMLLEDSRRLSIDLASGTVLDVLNGVVRAHGAMVWHWEELTEAQQQEWRAVGARRMLHFNLFRGPGKGFPIP